jgi:hypothetical protein
MRPECDNGTGGRRLCPRGSFTMTSHWSLPLLCVSCAVVFAGCATRPVNAPITEVNRNGGYRFQTRQLHDQDKENLVILAFSGGGTRAAAFSYGVLEALRRTEIIDSKGRKVRLLDEIDVITGVSGGSITALAYGLYGDELFDVNEARFLKRDVQGELLSRAAAGTNIDQSPEFQRLLRDTGVRVVPTAPAKPAAPALPVRAAN